MQIAVGGNLQLFNIAQCNRFSFLRVHSTVWGLCPSEALFYMTKSVPICGLLCADTGIAGTRRPSIDCPILHSFVNALFDTVNTAGECALNALPSCRNMKKTNHKKNVKANGFDPQVFLDTAGISRKIAEFRRNESIYNQGDAANSVMYVQQGGVKLSVVNGSGKEAVVAMFGPTDFFGEGCMAGQTVRMGTATAVTPTTVLIMEKDELLRVLHTEQELSDHFIRYMLAHNIRVEEDLVDQLFNSSEKRLARTLLILARYGKTDQPVRVLPKVSQETLASMVGTTRSRVNFFMNKFRKLGFIEYNGKIKVNKSLLTVVLHE
jgi:CRP/FNR family cyclic AMP-dependent transcriptional regulator